MGIHTCLWVYRILPHTLEDFYNQPQTSIDNHTQPCTLQDTEKMMGAAAKLRLTRVKLRYL